MFALRPGLASGLFFYMSDPFKSSRSKIAWAKKNTSKLNRKLKAFFRHHPYVPFAEPHPDREGFTVIKVRLRKQLPEDIPTAVSDILGNLRSALDHAVYAVAVAAGTPKPMNAYFPFSRTEKEFEGNLKGRCKDVPSDLYPVFRACKPYKGGNAALWALNAIRGTNDHAFIVPAVGLGSVAAMRVEGYGFWSAPAHPIWDSAKNEMELMTLGPQAKLKSNFDLAFQVTFGEVEEFAGRNVGEVLQLFAELVTTIVDRIEAESKRLGIVK
jgi:hypothetical protein